VTKDLRSDSLDVVALALGIAQSAGELSVFDDAFLSQVLDISSLVRRGRTLGASTGWYYGVMECVHAGADNQVTTLDPYSIDSQTQAPWQNPVPKGFDIWLGVITSKKITGAGNQTIGTFELLPDASQRSFGEDNAGGVVITNETLVLALADALITTSNGTDFFTYQGAPSVTVNQRIARGSQIRYRSTSDGAATLQTYFTIGLFPVGLGQDIAF